MRDTVKSLDAGNHGGIVEDVTTACVFSVLQTYKSLFLRIHVVQLAKVVS